MAAVVASAAGPTALYQLVLPPPPPGWLAVPASATPPPPPPVPAGQLAAVVARVAAALRLPAGLSVAQTVAAAAELLWLRLPTPPPPALLGSGVGGGVGGWSEAELCVNAAALLARLYIPAAAATAGIGQKVSVAAVRADAPLHNLASDGLPQLVAAAAAAAEQLLRLPADFEVVEPLPVSAGADPHSAPRGWLPAGVRAATASAAILPPRTFVVLMWYPGGKC